MATALIERIAIKGLACCVPRQTVDTANIDWLAPDERAKISRATGIFSRRIADGATAADFAYTAAEDLLQRLDWERGSIGALVLVTQHPDQLLPATSATLQRRLGLSTECACFDINLGCSGYVYGLWTAASLLGTLTADRVLLLVADTPSYVVPPADRSTGVLFSDGGSATALEKTPSAVPWFFHLASDGSGADAIIVPAGFRARRWNSTELMSLRLNGADVFNFSIRVAPPSVRHVLDSAGWTTEQVDAFVFHQANKMMNDTISKKLGLKAEQVPSTLADFGNSSSVSIPLTLTMRCSQALARRDRRLVLCGFGVGLSWASAAITTDQVVVAPLIEI